MPHDIAFKVGDQIRCPSGFTGNGIIAARRTEQDSETIIYTVFTDFGNTVQLSEIELLNHYVAINKDSTIEEFYGDKIGDNVQRWLIDRLELVIEQTHRYQELNDEKRN